MFVFSKASAKKIVHKEHCVFAAKIKMTNRVYFYSLRDAYAAGCRPCMYCSVLGSDFIKNRNKIKEFCAENNMECKWENGYIAITTSIDKWRIAVSDKAPYKLIIYHSNTAGISFGKRHKGKWLLEYHIQKMKHKDIMTTLQGIAAHTRYKLEDPDLPDLLRERFASITGKTMPKGERKGKKRRNKEKKWEERVLKRENVNRVMALLDGLKT